MQAGVIRELEASHTFTHELDPRTATLTNAACVPVRSALLIPAWQRTEFVAVVVAPTTPAPCALLNVNEVLLTSLIDVLDALATDAEDTRPGDPDPDRFAFRVGHDSFLDELVPKHHTGRPPA